MSTIDLAKTYKKFCPKCEHFQQETGVCRKFYFNVRDYPDKFIKKCNGDYFKEDITKVVQKIDEVEELEELENDFPESKESRIDNLSLRVNKRIGEEYVCNFCSNNFSIGEEIYKCEKCGSFYHIKCWQENGGCNQSECTKDVIACPNCGKEIKKSALKCKHCGSILDKTIAAGTIVPKGTVQEASDSIKYALFGFICFGIILGPIAISKGLKALEIIDQDPGYEGRGLACLRQ